jgi:hypothetical protein
MWRYYAPNTGRFFQEDPIGIFGGDINLFLYSRNQPVQAIDPLGLSTISFDREKGTLTVFTEKIPYAPELTFPATNNAVRPGANPYSPNGYGRLPTGKFNMGPRVYTGEDPNSSFGTGFYPIYLPPQIPLRRRTGTGVHSGRRDTCDNNRNDRCGVNYWTRGCVRTTNEAMDFLKKDPPTLIYVK